VQTDDDARGTADPLVGRTVVGGKYTIESVLGRGGMGVVYAAIQHPVNRKVALKVIHRELAGERHIVERFMQEMTLTAAIEHPHTVRLYDVGDLDGQPFITTELLEGRTLRDELARVGRMPPERVVAITLQIARALRGAREHGVVHRDLKPENIMLLDRYGERDYVKVLDFGIARSLHRTASDLRTGTGAIMGTPAYMSPEQCEGKPVDARSDLYALGLITYELCAGKLPFPPSPSIPQMLLAHVTQVPPDVVAAAPGVPAALGHLIMQLLAKMPDDRPADADAVIAALERLPGASSSLAPAHELATAPTAAALAFATVPPIPRAPVTRRFGRVGVALLGLATLGLGATRTFRGTRAPAGDETGETTAPGEPPFPASCAPALARALAEARRPGLGDGEAQQRLTAIVAACPMSAVARAQLGTTLARLDRDDEAEPHLRAALDLAPDYAPARFNLALVLLKRERSAEALALLDAVVAKDADHPTARLVRAQARLATGDAAGAVEDLRAQTGRFPDHGASWALLAEALARAGRPGDAKLAACRAVALGMQRERSLCGASEDAR
jgi:tRNA A-37 threonylcarbamoyl transferase component Bud32/Flp pilus assembly protein TadD